MKHQTVLITAVSLAGLIVAGAGAAAANLGILGSTTADVGQLSAAQPVVVPTTVQTIEIVIEDLPIPEVAAEQSGLTPTTPAGATAKTPVSAVPTSTVEEVPVAQNAAIPEPEVFNYAVGEAGSVRLQMETWVRDGTDATTKTEVHIEAVSVATGWTTNDLRDNGTSVAVSFVSGNRTLVFSADLVDDQIMAGVEEGITEPVAADGPGYDDDDDDHDHDDDDHDDDHDDGDEYEGHDDDD